MTKVFLIIVALAQASSLVSAIGNLTSAGCIDPSGFEKCQAAANSAETTCVNQADADASNLETIACGCESYIENFNCYAASCWNKVWECEYQEYMVGYFEDCPTAVTPVPYWPAPDNVPDACSCNLGNVYIAVTGSIAQSAKCSSNVTTSTDAIDSVNEEAECSCCEESSVVSSIYGICPDVDPTLIGLSSTNANGIDYYNFANCDGKISNDICENQLGWPKVAGGTYYDGSNLPASGTASYSNIAGTVTTPASGDVFTYTNGANSQVYTISAASVGKAAATTTSASSGTGTTAKGGKTSGTSSIATGAAASTSSKVGAAPLVAVQRYTAMLGARLEVLMIVLA